MLDLFKKNVLGPVAGRLGTFVGGSLMTIGVTQHHADIIGLGVASAIFVGCDLVTSWLIRQHNARAGK